MVVSKDQTRIVALQKQLRIARTALTQAMHGDLSRRMAEYSLEEMDKIEWASKPNLVQDTKYR